MKVKGIYKRGEIYWFGRMVNGKRTQVSLETSDGQAAIKKAKEIKDAGPIKDDERVGALCSRWIAHKVAAEEFTPKTESWARGALAQFQAGFDNPNVKRITRADIEGWYNATRQRIATASAGSYLAAVKAFFSWCKTEKYIALDPAKPVKKGKLGKAGFRNSFCTAKQRNKLIENAPNEDLRFILFVGFHAGLRRGEICEARRDWFDMENGIIWVRKTEKGSKRLREGEKPFPIKDNEERPITMSDPLKKFLTGYLDTSLDPLDFVLMPHTGYGVSIYRYDFRAPFGEYMLAQKCPEVTPHVMRRTFASLLVQAGVPIYKVAKWLGDGEAVTAKHYAHLCDHDNDINKMV